MELAYYTYEGTVNARPFGIVAMQVPTLAWLNRSTVGDINLLLGPPFVDEAVCEGDESQGRRRAWQIAAGEVLRFEADPPFHRVLSVLLPRSELPFSLEAALGLAGASAEWPFAPTCTPDGNVSWGAWPGLGSLTIHYGSRAVSLASGGDGGGGGSAIDLDVAIPVGRPVRLAA